MGAIGRAPALQQRGRSLSVGEGAFRHEGCSHRCEQPAGVAPSCLVALCTTAGAARWGAAFVAGWDIGCLGLWDGAGSGQKRLVSNACSYMLSCAWVYGGAGKLKAHELRNKRQVRAPGAAQGVQAGAGRAPSGQSHRRSSQQAVENVSSLLAAIPYTLP